MRLLKIEMDTRQVQRFFIVIGRSELSTLTKLVDTARRYTPRVEGTSRLHNQLREMAKDINKMLTQ